MPWLMVIGALAILLGTLAFLFLYACTVPHSQVFGPALVRGPGNDRRVALTFDDGPAAQFTEQVLDILREHDVPATFFLCGKNVERFPEIVRRIHNEGHTLGNHTFTHPFLWSCSRARLAHEIDRTQDSIAKVAGLRPVVFRSPYGIRWFGLFPLLRERGMQAVQWSNPSYDWKKNINVDEILRATLRGLGPGSVILLHDGLETPRPRPIDASKTVEALPEIINECKKEGFKFVSVLEFLPAS